MQKCIAYYAQTPAIDALCEKYGSHWQNMPHLEALNIASAIAQSVAKAEGDVFSALMLESSISYLATCEGFTFQDHNKTIQLLDQLDSELNSHTAMNLVTGIYSNVKIPD